MYSKEDIVNKWRCVMKIIRHNVRYVLGFLVLFCLFSFIQWTEDRVSFGPVTAEAKITEDTIPPEGNCSP